MVNQVTVIGILMIVNGALQVLMGILYAVGGPMFLSIIPRQAMAQAPAPQAQQMDQVFTVISIVYLALGGLVAFCGCMNIAGGISALRFRSRTFVITALFFNIPPMITCYCLPTSLGLIIWGLIVMFQGDVAHAFTLGASGYSADEIKDRMGVSGYRRSEMRRDDWDRRDDRGAAAPLPGPQPEGKPGDEHIVSDEAPPEPKPRETPPPKPGSGGDQFFEK